MTFRQATARCWAEIDIDTLTHNYQMTMGFLGGRAKLIAVLKANAYGLGARGVSKALYNLGARDFAVAMFSEALEIKAECEDARVLVMGLTGEDDVCAAAVRGITLTVFSNAQAEMLLACARQVYKDTGVRLTVQAKIETGLHRLGFSPEDAPGAIMKLAADPAIELVGAFTHLALRDKESDDRQFALFEGVRRTLEEKGVALGMWHACDSIGMVRYPEKHYDAVRVGAWLYGVCPYRYPHPEEDRLALTLRTRIAQIRTLPAGECVGYDDAHSLARESRVATLSAGYVDGYPRFNHIGEVEIRGARAKVLGLVCMDQMMVDVTDIPNAREGDVVTLLGGGIGVDEYAAWAHMNRNEALSRVGRRVPRVYILDGSAVRIDSEMER